LAVQPKGWRVFIRINIEPKEFTVKKFLASCVALVLMASPALAADAAKTAVPDAGLKKVVMPGHVREHKGVFEQADANNDGVVTKEEFIAAETKYFDSVDTDHDGKLSKDEIKAQREAAMKKRMMWRSEHKDDAAPASTEQK
jgi:hypothetical protein